ncbi:MAG: hypothetical protein CMH31_04415 [Micavibrio sp.]|nr:hypothetical protein [Micavibrio sp.]
MLKFRRRRRNEQSFQSDSGTLMNLSLFIMLLAFFIVLNSLSSYEEQLVGDVVQSLDTTFSKDPQKEDIAPSVTPDPVNSVKEGDTFERIDALFQSQIISYKKSISSNRGKMIIKLPLEKFSRAIMAAGQKDLTKMNVQRNPRGNFIIPTLVSILKSDKKNITYRMNILLQVPDNPAHFQNQSPTEMAALMRRGSALTERLEQGGFPQKLLNIGVAKGNPAIVVLVFEPHIPFSPVEEAEQGGRDG